MYMGHDRLVKGDRMNKSLVQWLGVGIVFAALTAETIINLVKGKEEEKK